MATKKEIADDKRTAKAQKRTDEFEKNLASMSPRNKEHFEAGQIFNWLQALNT
jgi:hypothetical protein